MSSTEAKIFDELLESMKLVGLSDRAADAWRTRMAWANAGPQGYELKPELGNLPRPATRVDPQQDCGLW